MNFLATFFRWIRPANRKTLGTVDYYSYSAANRNPKRMKLTVKTLKGGKFTVEVDPSNTVAEAKGIIVSPAPGFIRCMSRLTVCGTD